MSKLDTQIDKATKEVLIYEEKLKNAKKKLADLEQKKEELELKAILQISKQKGLSLSTVKELVNKEIKGKGADNNG